ncbi:hypothetical protein KIW84_043944 [Lathyrus oleraceus]|uniref:Hydroxyproline O-arabinosyltransferase-like domain-containing protein n=1 Tax=Pisum sativum TaxID=3888 RepID=A0A9D5AVC1_PEA|nr:hypothetical protein KIW84_043944 [Pisum sativum]
MADLEGVLDPQPRLLDALLWEPEYDIVSDNNDSEYNVKEGITLDNSVQLINHSTNHSLLNRLVSFNTAVCFAMMDIRNFMQFYVVDLKNEQVERNVWVVEMICNLPGNVTRLLSCSGEDLMKYKGHDLVPTHSVPSMNRYPLTGDWYPAIKKPAAVIHWLNHVKIDAEYIVILDADMIMRGPITPWEFKASRTHPVSTNLQNYILAIPRPATTNLQNYILAIPRPATKLVA